MNDDTSMITPEVQGLIQANSSKLFDGSISVEELGRIVFKDDRLDGRDKKIKALNQWLIDNGLKVKSKPVRETIEILEPEQIEFIKANIDKMKSMEMARALWPSKKMTPLNKEFILLQRFCRELRPEAVPDGEKMADGPYKAPKSIYYLVPRINSYIGKYQMGDVKPLPQNEAQIPERELKNLRVLLRYMNTPTFIHAVNIYGLEQERELFESKFIRFTFETPDLTEIEVDQYINLCDKAVSLHQIKKNNQILQAEINQNFDSSDGDKKKLAMTYVELLGGYRQKEADAESALEKTLKSLVGGRNERLKGRLADNATVMNLVEAFQNEKKRLELVALAEQQRNAERHAVENLSSMDAVVALIAGFSKEQARNGE